MAKNEIQESQQASQGKTIGTQGNDDVSVPDGMKGSHRSKEGHEDRHIPNQDHSSATNQERADSNRQQNH